MISIPNLLLNYPLFVLELTKYMDTVLPLVLDGLSGRTWDGKEHVVNLLPSLALSSKAYFNDKSPKLQEIAKVSTTSLSLTITMSTTCVCYLHFYPFTPLS